MTLEEAIKHAKEIIENKNCSKECAKEHEQLINWLKELKMYREKNENVNS